MQDNENESEFGDSVFQNSPEISETDEDHESAISVPKPILQEQIKLNETSNQQGYGIGVIEKEVDGNPLDMTLSFEEAKTDSVKKTKSGKLFVMI